MFSRYCFWSKTALLLSVCRSREPPSFEGKLICVFFIPRDRYDTSRPVNTEPPLHIVQLKRSPDIGAGDLEDKDIEGLYQAYKWRSNYTWDFGDWNQW